MMNDVLIKQDEEPIETEQEEWLLKRYYKDERVFIRVKGILPAWQYEALKKEMGRIATP